MRNFLGFLLCALGACSVYPEASEALRYERIRFENADFDVVRVDLRHAELTLHWKDAQGKPLENFYQLRDHLQAEGHTLLFAMNSGIYARDYTPLGLHIEAGQELEPLNRKTGGGNFFLQPNGVFSISDGKPRIDETEAYHAAGLSPQLATQSGPLLLDHGTIHPKFRPDSDSVHVRNGVGVDGSGMAIFVISRRAINFHHFARFFRDALRCESALYLDGALSGMYYPPAGRNGPGVKYVGMLAVAEPAGTPTSP